MLTLFPSLNYQNLFDLAAAVAQLLSLKHLAVARQLVVRVGLDILGPRHEVFAAGNAEHRRRHRLRVDQVEQLDDVGGLPLYVCGRKRGSHAAQSGHCDAAHAYITIP